MEIIFITPNLVNLSKDLEFLKFLVRHCRSHSLIKYCLSSRHSFIRLDNLFINYVCL